MRYLSLDLGDQRIGVAISDAIGFIARPLDVFRRTSRAADFEHIGALAQQHQAGALIVGLPLNMNGSEGKQAQWVRDYSAALSTALALPVELWDERLTTEEAYDLFRAQGRTLKKNWVDAVAAAVILQSYLDAHRPDSHAAHPDPTDCPKPEES